MARDGKQRAEESERKKIRDEEEIEASSDSETDAKASRKSTLKVSKKSSKSSSRRHDSDSDEDRRKKSRKSSRRDDSESEESSESEDEKPSKKNRSTEKRSKHSKKESKKDTKRDESDSEDSEDESDENKNQSETGEKKFRKALTSLAKYLRLVSEEIDKESSSGTKVLETSKRTIAIGKFEKNIERSDYKLLRMQFKRLLDKNRSSIKRGPRYDSWLRGIFYNASKKKLEDGHSVSLSIPSTKDDQNLGNQTQVNLTKIYLESLQLRDKTQAKLNGPEKFDRKEDADKYADLYNSSNELIYPEAIRLYIWRIFAAIAEEVGETPDTAIAIRESIESLEIELGVLGGSELIRKMMRETLGEGGMLSNLFEMLKQYAGGLHPAISEYSDIFLDELREFAEGRKSMSDSISSLVDAVFNKVPGNLGKKAAGRDAIGEVKETLSGLMGGLGKDDKGESLGPMETITKMMKIMRDLQKSEYVQKKMREFQSEIGDVRSIEDAKKVDPMKFFQLIAREVNNAEMINEIERVTGKSVEQNEIVSTFVKLSRIIESIRVVLHDEGILDEEKSNSIKKAILVTNGEIGEQ